MNKKKFSGRFGKVKDRRVLGRESEDLAAYRLEKDGYKIIARNYRTKLGEIDIVARDGDTVVFVEVKARQSNRFGSPKWALTPAKRRKISMVALYYLKVNGLRDTKARFDVITVSAVSERPRVEIIKNAFDLAYG